MYKNTKAECIASLCANDIINGLMKQELSRPGGSLYIKANLEENYLEKLFGEWTCWGMPILFLSTSVSVCELQPEQLILMFFLKLLENGNICVQYYAPR